MANTLFLSLDPGAIDAESVERRARLQTAILDSSADAIVVSDESGIVYANKTARKLLGPGFPAAFRIQRADGTLVVENDLPMMRAVRGESFDGEELCLKRIGAPDLWVSVSGRALIDEGLPRGGVVTLRDITAAKSMERRLLLADRMATLGTLAAGVAHEINNPLNGVLGGLDLALSGLEKQLPRERLESMLKLAHEGAKRVERIVGDLRTLSSGSDVTTDVDLAKVASAAIAIARATVQKRAQIVESFSPAPAIKANEPRLVQVVMNLLVNAAQAIPEGKPGAEVRVSVLSEKSKAILTVEDTGGGIPPEVLPKIFEPFFTTKAPGEGTGLGLWISQGIVSSFGGEIEVTSAPGRTTFRVMFPV